ncbi:SemiSWEET transporter [Aurantibacter crassamenti]|uniref:SemiSWEET family sugar transporter n=1 Tax=Aurantibacter crassamenti TaxID=1837375 RepID=UPI00193A15FB|nr:SemiSWEET transporter [Aurantibacter crassamenti]MBM1104803.1 SemiSWEET transporter [Aurantibacter crassamenti]
MNYIEILGLVAAVVTTSCFIPQVYKISKEKSTKDISLVMYLTMALGLSLWLVYGIAIESMPVTLANGITLVLVGWIIILKLKYK